MTERAAPFYCPYCGETDLRPGAPEHGAGWECAGCNRSFQLTFRGLLASGAQRGTAPPDASGTESGRNAS